DSSQVIFGLEILEANVPDKGSESLNGIHFVPLCADKSEPQVLVRIFWKALLSICRVVVACVFESVEAHVAQRHSASLEMLGIDSHGCRGISAWIAAGHAANWRQQSLQLPSPHRKSGLGYATFDICSDRRLGPIQHRLIIGQDPAQAADARRV